MPCMFVIVLCCSYIRVPPSMWLVVIFVAMRAVSRVSNPCGRDGLHYQHFGHYYFYLCCHYMMTCKIMVLMLQWEQRLVE